MGSDTEFSNLEVAADIEVGAKCCESLILDLEARRRLGSEHGAFMSGPFIPARERIDRALLELSYLCARRKPFTLKMLSSL
jgi:hypothetical protein